MENNKSPGNDGLTNKYSENFLPEIKSLLLLSFQNGFLSEELSTTQKQATIKLLDKKKKKKKKI